MTRITWGRRWSLPALLVLFTAALLVPPPAPAQSGSVVVDDDGAGFSTSPAWIISGGVAGAYGGSYRHDGGSGAEPGSWARWQPAIPASGYYQISMRWAAHSNRPDAAPVTVAYDGGVDVAVRVNQQQSNNTWVVLGTYPMAAGSSGYVQIGADDAGYTVADAVQFTPTTVPPPSFPSFAFQGVALNPASLSYNPTGEIIFPSVIRAADHFTNPLGDYYLYYAPHDSPGGISLAYSDSPTGPWTEYAHNPVISNVWSPHYNVGHVSSPHVIWNADEGKLFLYFHGDNDKTRLAASADGVTFSYEGVMVSTTMFSNVSETSYARVFAYTIPAKQNRYIMLLMGNNAGTRRIYLAWSNDGRSWTTQATPLISPNAEEGANLSGPWFYPWGGEYYVLYHASSGNIHITRVGANFDHQQHLGVFYDDPADRAASPALISHNGYTYMLYERGPRLSAEIAYARAGGAAQRFEAEGLPVSTSGDAHSVFADAQMSEGAGTKLNANSAGDFATYTLPVAAAGTYSVRVRVKRQNTRGIYQLGVQGAPLGQPMDFYASGDTYEELTVGTVRFASPGSTTVSFTAVGKNSNSQGLTLGLDYIALVPLP
jgi:hypothetical protein